MPSAICQGCGANTNSAISNYWCHLEPDNETPKERGVVTVCYAAFDAPNDRWIKGCFYDKLPHDNIKRFCVDRLIERSS